MLFLGAFLPPDDAAGKSAIAGMIAIFVIARKHRRQGNPAAPLCRIASLAFAMMV
jgi:hypothetical protein